MKKLVAVVENCQPSVTFPERARAHFEPLVFGGSSQLLRDLDTAAIAFQRSITQYEMLGVGEHVTQGAQAWSRGPHVEKLLEPVPAQFFLRMR